MDLVVKGILVLAIMSVIAVILRRMWYSIYRTYRNIRRTAKKFGRAIGTHKGVICVWCGKNIRKNPVHIMGPNAFGKIVARPLHKGCVKHVGTASGTSAPTRATGNSAR